MTDEYTENLLRPDNYELFDNVRNRLNARPVEPIDCIARDVGVSVDDLCRWVIGFREKGRPTSPYQKPAYAPLRPPSKPIPDQWADTADRRRQAIWKKQREGAAAARANFS